MENDTNEHLLRNFGDASNASSFNVFINKFIELRWILKYPTNHLKALPKKSFDFLRNLSGILGNLRESLFA